MIVFSRRQLLSLTARASVLAAACGLSAACGSTAPAASSPVQPAGTAPTVAPAVDATKPTGASAPSKAPPGGAKVVLMRWGNVSEVDVTNKGIDLFQKNNPGSTVDFQHVVQDYASKLQTSIAGNVAPDVFLLGAADFTPYMTKGLLENQLPYIQRDHFDIDDYYEAGTKQYLYQGKQGGMPRGLGRTGLIYNQDLFAKAGLQPPPTDWNAKGWDFAAFLDSAQKIVGASKGGPTTYGLLFQPTNFRHWAGMIWSNGGQVFSDDDKTVLLDQPPAVEALQAMADWVFKHKVAPRTENTSDESPMSLFTTGRIGMEFTEPFTFAERRKAAKFTWDAAVTPAGAGGRVVGGGGAGWLSYSGSKNKDATWKFFSFLAGKEFQTMECEAGTTTPPRKSVTNAPCFLNAGTPKHMDVFATNLQIMRTDPSLPRWNELITAWNKELSYLWTGERDAKTVTAAMKKVGEPLLVTP